MVSLPNFAISLQKLLHKLVKKEAAAAAKQINDIASGPLTRETPQWAMRGGLGISEIF